MKSSHKWAESLCNVVRKGLELNGPRYSDKKFLIDSYCNNIHHVFDRQETKLTPTASNQFSIRQYNETIATSSSPHIPRSPDDKLSSVSAIGSSINPYDSVYVNNYVNLQQVQVVGFDLDYTLATYSDSLQELIYKLAMDILVSSFGFPSCLKDVPHASSYAIRGLSVDMQHGLLCKLSHLQRVAVNATYKGKKALDLSEIEELYGESRHVPYNRLEHMRPLYDLYSIVEANLIANCMDYFEHRKYYHGEHYSSSAVMDDIEAAIREVHTSGLMHNAILDDLPKYINSSPKLMDLFQHLHDGGKKMFLCTNSSYKYADKVLSYILGMSMGPNKGTSRHKWRDIFDVVICSASKPSFYNTKQPFRQWNTDSDIPSTAPVKSLEKGLVYIHGSCYVLHRLTGWKGKEILYIGDNLRSDLREARRWHGWHTACVIRELTHEITVQHSIEFQQLYDFRGLTRQLIQDFQNLTLLEKSQKRGTMQLLASVLGLTNLILR